MRAESAASCRCAAGIILILCCVVIGVGAYLWLHEDPRQSLGASVRVKAVGVDPHGFWFARLEVVNEGALPWRYVLVSNSRLGGSAPIAVEVGSTLPHDPVPTQFEFVIEAVSEGEVPQASTVSFDLGVVTELPWYSSAPNTTYWPFSLPL